MDNRTMEVVGLFIVELRSTPNFDLPDHCYYIVLAFNSRGQNRNFNVQGYQLGGNSVHERCRHTPVKGVLVLGPILQNLVT